MLHAQQSKEALDKKKKNEEIGKRIFHILAIPKDSRDRVFKSKGSIIGETGRGPRITWMCCFLKFLSSLSPLGISKNDSNIIWTSLKDIQSSRAVAQKMSLPCPLGWAILCSKFLKMRNLEWTKHFCIIFGMLISKISKFSILMHFFLFL